jgi:ribosome biogenesis GTP-binding protein YsxC/EngB
LDIRTVSFSRAAYKPEDFPQDGRPQFAIVGRSNVGKSTLINTLLRRKNLARVSHTPGKTQAIQFYLINERFYIVDLPGYGYAKVSREVSAAWERLILVYLEVAEPLREIFFLVDGRRVPADLDLQMRDWLGVSGIDWSVIMTKVDKLSKSQLAANARTIVKTLEIDPERLIRFSSVTREGVDQIWRVIDSRTQKKTTDESRAQLPRV